MLLPKLYQKRGHNVPGQNQGQDNFSGFANLACCLLSAGTKDELRMVWAWETASLSGGNHHPDPSRKASQIYHGTGVYDIPGICGKSFLVFTSEEKFQSSAQGVTMGTPKYFKGQRLYWDGMFMVNYGGGALSINLSPRMVFISEPDLVGDEYYYITDPDSGSYKIPEVSLHLESPDGNEPDVPDFTKDTDDIERQVAEFARKQHGVTVDLHWARVIPRIKEEPFTLFEVARCLVLRRTAIREWMSEGIIFSSTSRQIGLRRIHHQFTRWQIYGIEIVRELREIGIHPRYLKNIFEKWVEQEDGLRNGKAMNILYMIAPHLGVNINFAQIIEHTDSLIHKSGRR